MLLWDRTDPEKVHWRRLLAGREDYEVTEGSVEFFGKDLLELVP